MNQKGRSPDAEEGPDGTHNVAAASATGAAWTLLSRATGFIRVAVVAATLGATYLANTYGITNYLPNLALEFAAGSVLGSLLVPPLVRALDTSGRESAERLAGAFLGLVLVAFTGAAVLLALAGPLVLKLLSAGISDSDAAAGQQSAGWVLLALQVWQIPLYALIQVAVAAQTARGRFALAAGAPSIENVGIMIIMGLYAAIYGTGGVVSRVETTQLLLLGGGSTLAVAAHAAVQWWGARRAGITLIPRTNWRAAEVLELVARGRLAFRLSALSAGRTFGAFAVANSLPGGVIAFQVGLNFLWLPSAIGARPVAIALQPALARLYHRGAAIRFQEQFARGASVVLFIAVPAAAFYAVLAGPLAALVAYGEFDSGEGLALMQAAIAGLGVGVVGDSSFILGSYASFARDDARAPYRAMVVGSVVAAAGILGATFVNGTARLLALSLAYSASTAVAAWFLVRSLSGPRTRRRLRAAVLRALLASAAMAAPAYVLAVQLPADASERAMQVVGLAAAIACGSAIFLIVQWAVRSPELRYFLAAVPFERISRRSH